jgi:copper chaperone NosL
VTAGRRLRWTGVGAGLALGLGALGCARPDARPIGYGEETCRHCHMTITDPRFAAELVTRTGKVYVFDDVGCLAAFAREGTVAAADVGALWVFDYLAPDSMLDARRAVFLRVDTLATPMSSGVVALRPGPRADSLRARWGGRFIPWADVPTQGHRG